MKTEQVNILYDTLGKVELVEMVLKAQGMDLEDIKKVKEQISNKLKELTC